MRAQFQDTYPGIQGFADGLDSFLVGVGFRYGTDPVPVYDYVKCLKTLGYHGSSEFLRHHHALLPLPPKEMFWDCVANRKYAVWEHLNRAIMGVMHAPGYPHAVAYSYGRVLSILGRISEYSSVKTNEEVETLRFFDTKLGKAWIGERTPFFIHVM